MLKKELYGKRTHPAPDRTRIDIILRLTGTGKRVLDIGCYDGVVGREILVHQNEVYGIDISENAIRSAQAKDLDVCIADVDAGLPFRRQSFDEVIAGEVIEHVSDPDGLIEEIRRVLTSRGYLIVSTPNLASLGRRLLLFLGRNPLVETRSTEETAGHVRYFVKDTLFDLLASHDFIVETFASDVVNFTLSGRFRSARLAKIFPTIGRTLIVKAKVKDG